MNEFLEQKIFGEFKKWIGGLVLKLKKGKWKIENNVLYIFSGEGDTLKIDFLNVKEQESLTPDQKIILDVFKDLILKVDKYSPDILSESNFKHKEYLVPTTKYLLFYFFFRHDYKNEKNEVTRGLNTVWQLDKYVYSFACKINNLLTFKTFEGVLDYIKEIKNEKNFKNEDYVIMLNLFEHSLKKIKIKYDLVDDEDKTKLLSNVIDLVLNEKELYKYLNSLDKNTKDSKSKIFGFESNLDDKKIALLYNILATKRLIDYCTNKEHFKAVFINSPLPNNFQKIKWKKAKNLLSYFIDKLFFETEPHLWKKAEYCFENAKELRQAKENYLNNKSGKPKNYQEIDSIINSLYNTLQ